MAGLFGRLQNAYKAFRFGGFGGGLGNGLGDFYGGGSMTSTRRLDYDYEREAGFVWENSVFWSGLRWIANNYQDADPCALIYSKGSTKPAISVDHPYARLMDEPNPDYDGGTMAWAIVTSLLCAGRSYLMVERSSVGIPTALYWVPWWQLTARWPSDGSKFIGWYDYHVNGRIFPVPRSSVVDIRLGMNPMNYRGGMSGAQAVLPQICTINEGARFMAAITRNPAVFSALFSPKGQIQLNPKQHDDLKAKLNEFTGEGRGGVLVPTIPLEVTKLAWSPEEMALDTSLKMPESHIAASMGLSTIVLNLTSGERRDTFANKAAAIRESYDNGVRPLQRCVSRQMRRSLSVLFADNEKAGYDYSQVACQQEARADRAKRLKEAAGGPYLSVNEARVEDGYPRLGPEYDKVRANPGASAQADDEEPPKPPDTDEDEEEDDDEQ